jgi:DNA-directed RNA polymerase subunit M/transcription elongation factor TFIIS
MTSITSAEEFYYKCDKCQKVKMPSAADTMLYEESANPDLTIHTNIINSAARDPVNPKAYRDCKACGYNIVKQVRINRTMNLINVCVQCENKWKEGQ